MILVISLYKGGSITPCYASFPAQDDFTHPDRNAIYCTLGSIARTTVYCARGEKRLSVVSVVLTPTLFLASIPDQRRPWVASCVSEIDDQREVAATVWSTSILSARGNMYRTNGLLFSKSRLLVQCAPVHPSAFCNAHAHLFIAYLALLRQC